MLKTFYNKTLDGFGFGPTAAVVVAENQEEAAKFLNIHIKKLDFEQENPILPEDMIEVVQVNAHVVILVNGDS